MPRTVIVLETPNEQKIFTSASSGVPILPWSDEVAEDIGVFVGPPSAVRVAEIVAAALDGATAVCSWKGPVREPK